MLQRLLSYLNPITHLGDRRYSIVFPTIFIISLYLISEGLAKTILTDTSTFGMYVILVSIAAIIYLAFRSGVRGGIVATVITVAYYLYIIYAHNYSEEQSSSGIQTAVVLGLLYLFIGWIIGWLKQTIDILIDQEGQEKRRLQAIVQQLPVGIIIADNKGRVVQTNRQLETILGTKIPIGHIMGKDDVLVKSIQANRPITPSHSPLTQVLTTGKAIVGKEFVIDKEGGKKTFVQVSASPIRNRKKDIIAAASIITDITLQKEMEKRKDDFVNMASHELKTPITSLKLYIDILRRSVKKYKDAQVIKTLKSIDNQTNRLSNLVNDLLDVSRLQTGKLHFTKESFRIDQLVKETIGEISEISRQHAITMVKSQPIVVKADKFRIYQVVTNLLTNSIKYSGNEKKIDVRIIRKAGKVVVSVQDFGIGIEKEQQKKIFDRLYQVTDSSEKTFPGLGMGLYIAREIIKKHRGIIWVESEKGKGSTFSFSLPLK